MTTTTRACLLAIALLVSAPVSVAQALPKPGMSMDEVQRNHGAPTFDLGAVGHPAITRWVYDGFTVYFEGRRVISTVQTQPLADSATGPVNVPPSSVDLPGSSKDEPAAIPVRAATPTPATLSPAPPATAVLVPTPGIAPQVTVNAEQKIPAKPVITAPEQKKAPTPVVTETPVAKPIPFTPPPTPAPAMTTTATPATIAPTPAPAPSKASASGNSFRFDPETGRLILNEEETPASPATTSESDATEPAATGDVGTALDQTLEFDPETGTFRAR